MASIVFYLACLFALYLYLLAYFTFLSRAIGFFQKGFKFLPDFRSDIAAEQFSKILLVF